MKKANWVGITSTDGQLSTYALLNLETGVTVSAGRPNITDRFLVIWQNAPGSPGSEAKGSAKKATPPKNILLMKLLPENEMYVFMLELASQLEVGYNEWFQEFTNAVEREPAN